MPCLIAIAFLTAATPPAVLDRPVPQLATGIKFQRALSVTLKEAGWKGVPLRTMLAELMTGAKIAIVLDRRIDPTQTPELKMKNVSLTDLLGTIAKAAKAKAVVVGNVVYIGPPNAADVLPGLVKQRVADVRKFIGRVPVSRRSKILQRRTTHWNDLDTPREILEQIGKDAGLEFKGTDKLPHDLWSHATLPNASLWEALSLVLIQFDLTYRWMDKAAGIEIVPLPKPKKASK